MQISQMIVGVAITVYGFIYSMDPSCGVVPKVLYVQGVIYGSYLYLFLEFLVKRFFGGKTTPSSKSASSKGAALNGGSSSNKPKAQ